MELQQLAAFDAVAEAGSFTQAAHRLGMSQSSVSRAVRSLEDEFGLVLLDRTTRSVDLTPEGRLVLPEIRRALEAAKSLSDLMEQVRGGLRGILRVGILQRDPGFPLPRVLAGFAAEHPGIEVQLKRGNTATHALNLRNGLLDIAFVAIPSLPGLDITPLRRTAMALAAPPDHPLADTSAVTLDDLAGQVFADVPRSWGIRIANDQAFAAAGVQRQVAYEVADIGSVIDFVHYGLALAIVPPLAVPADTTIRTLRLADPAPAYCLGLAIATHRPPGAATQAFTQTAVRLTDEPS